MLVHTITGHRMLPAVVAISGMGFAAEFGVGGAVGCRGDDHCGQSDFLADTGTSARIASAVDHTIALRTDRTVASWGQNDLGECNVRRDLGTTVAVAAGGRNSAALTALANGAVECAVITPGVLVGDGGAVLLAAPVAGQMQRDELAALAGPLACFVEPAPPGIFGDLDGDGCVSGGDLGILLGSWSDAGDADLNHDGIVDGADMGLLLGSWGDGC